MFTKLFEQINKKDTSIAGGKGASLGEMTKAKIPVPEGFVVLSTTFDRFIEKNDLNIEIDAALDSINPKDINSIEKASKKIQSLIINIKISKELKEEIIKEFRKLKTKFVAVRSSATAEDSASAAWAGQLDTFLNTTEKDLIKNVKKCWASLFTPRAIFYRFEQKLHKEKVSVAVVIQKMVNSEESGIAFSVHPVTQDKNQLIIEAGFGLGEAIVSGQITPDSYVVDKQDKHIIDINVNEQNKGLYKKKDGGNEWKDLKEKGKKQVLNDKEIIELSELIIKIENHYKFPCDIEWAKEKGKFHITQSRPITTLSRDKKQVQKAKKSTDYKLDVSLTDAGIKWVKEAEISLDKDKYLFFINDILIYPVIAKVEKRTKKLEGVASYIDRKNKINRLYTSEDKTRGYWGYDFFLNEKRFNKYLKEIEEVFEKADIFRKKMDKIDLQNISLKEIIKIFTKDISILIQAKVLTYFTLPPYAWKIEESLRNSLLEFMPEKDLSETIGILTLQEQRDSLENERYYWLKNVLLPAFDKYSQFNEIEKDNACQEKIERHIKKYKNYSAGLDTDPWNTEYYLITLKEDFGMGKRFIKKEFLKLRDKKSLNRAKKQKIVKKYKLDRNLIKKAEIMGRLAKIRLDLRVLAWSFYVYIFCKLLDICSERAKLPKKIIGNLTYAEFITFLKNDLKINPKLRREIEARRKQNTLTMATPKHGYQVLWNKFADQKLHSEIEPKEAIDQIKEFKGEVACKRGIVKGSVFMFKYGSSDFLKRISLFPNNSILVSNVTVPVLMPAIRKAKAMVTDGGGITCHAAIVSRELGIPCVIGVGIATKVLKDGDVIEVDTDKGIVRIIKRT